jgi:hypothetical protein
MKGMMHVADIGGMRNGIQGVSQKPEGPFLVEFGIDGWTVLKWILNIP